ncbi:threonine/homoserine efflux transporter RhtA [Ureibacillus chungkukjangi]|uniref:Threonine/homoserine efflux transporter RhtA n=1 Tax=Ureibacillus chungkukjangi TaxID=1202712 RepID=A0A318TM65_9BACL|nr:DMT family transporter [Ureibacillus chungkukjangi]PYF05941.1 threonine/homoserine efflux transporter RhtA [Ureibacillus chungkukjangi]
MLKVYGIMILTMFLWGINVSLLKLLVFDMPPLVMQGTRIFLAGITLFLILLVMKKKIIYKEMPWKFVFLATLLGVVAHHSLLATGIAQTTAVKTSLILGLAPLITAIIAVATRATSLTKLRFTGFIIGFLGIVIAVVDDIGAVTAFVLGDVYVLASIVVQAFSFFIIRRITVSIPPLVLTAYMLTLGSTVMILYNLVMNPSSFLAFSNLDIKLWSVFLFSAMFATAIGHSLFNSMIKRLGTAESAIFTNLSTIFALTGSVVILNEHMHLSQILGCMLIIIGVLIGTGGLEDWIRKRREIHTPPVSEGTT